MEKKLNEKAERGAGRERKRKGGWRKATINLERPFTVNPILDTKGPF